MWCADKMQHCKAGKTCVPSVLHDVSVSFIYSVDLACRLIQVGTVSFCVGVLGLGVGG